MAKPQVFVSHSYADNEYCRAFVAALREALGDDNAVWYDEHNLGWGNIRRTIERELENRQHFIAILSPNAVESDWVNDEIDAARGLLREGKMQTVSFVTAVKCDVPRLLRGYKRVELADGTGYPPSDAAEKVLRAIEPSGDLSVPATATVSATDSNHPVPTTIIPQRPMPQLAFLPGGHLPNRLERLGFVVAQAREDWNDGKDVLYILPPLCTVPAGSFLMGSDQQKEISGMRGDYDPEPQHEVTLPAYQIGRFPVTVAEYACFVASNHPAPKMDMYHRVVDWPAQLTRLDHPVTGVTSGDAHRFAAWLARLTGQQWKLPSEAEWEKAARWAAGRVARIYPWGNYFDLKRCNTVESGINCTTPIGTFGGIVRDGSSPCGAQDMAGNVWEWTSTRAAVYADQQGDAFADIVRRGGSWRHKASLARTDNRSNHELGFRDASDDIGFRLVLGTGDST